MSDFDVKKYINKQITRLKSINWAGNVRPKISAFFSTILVFLSSWWQVLLLSLTAFICLYYPLGALWINNIDKNTDYEISIKNPEQSSTVETAAFLINREINDKMWTPNLPFFFPSYFLDNMPNFQMGIIKSISTLTSAMSNKLDSSIINVEDEPHLKKAAKLLKYNGRIWMFSPENSFSPAPSAHSQYRKARKQLIKFNKSLNSGQQTFYRNPADLAYFLKKINKDLSLSLENIDTQVREERSEWTDFKADDVFYYNQGKAYAYYLLLKALGNDYKEILVQKNAYALWIKSIKALEDASKLDAVFIRNAELNSLVAPNHLQYLAYDIIKAIAANKNIIEALTYTEKNKE